MSGLTKEKIENRINLYLDAEEKALQGERYKIKDKELQRASLSDIRKGLTYWENKLKSLGKRRGAKISRIIPRDI